MKAFSPGVDLHAAFDHQGPGDQHGVRHRPRAVPLVGPQVGHPCAQGFAPAHRRAVVARVPGKGGGHHLGHEALQQIRRAAVAVAGQQQRVAGHCLQAAVWPLQPHAQHALRLVHHELAGAGLGQQRDPAALLRLRQRLDEGLAGALAQGVHAVARVAGVQEAVEHFPLQAVAVGQEIQRRRDGFGVGLYQVRRRCAVGLVLDVLGKAPGRIVHPQRPLHLGSRGGDEAGRQAGRPRRTFVAFGHHALDAPVRQPQRRGQAASPGPDHQHRNLHRRGEARLDHHAGRRRHASPSCTKVAASTTRATLARSLSAVAWTSALKAAQPSAITQVS